MKLAVIAGTGAEFLFTMPGEVAAPEETPYGLPSSPVVPVRLPGRQQEIGLVYRHGPDGDIPPHRVNYRANLWQLKQFAPDGIIGLNAVGGIAPAATAGRICIPDQLIDYTWGRAHTFADGQSAALQHIDFTEPFAAPLRRRLLEGAQSLALEIETAGTYGVTQGPRLETAAEIDRLERDGCDLVGMTAMPEAALARELGLAFAVCALIVNRAAGRGEPGQDIHAEIGRVLSDGMQTVGRLLATLD